MRTCLLLASIILCLTTAEAQSDKAAIDKHEFDYLIHPIRSSLKPISEQGRNFTCEAVHTYDATDRSALPPGSDIFEKDIRKIAVQGDSARVIGYVYDRLGKWKIGYVYVINDRYAFYAEKRTPTSSYFVAKYGLRGNDDYFFVRSQLFDTNTDHP